ncbi:hypothetical protein H0H93_012116, partial [Arthromyces matolae]
LASFNPSPAPSASSLPHLASTTSSSSSANYRRQHQQYQTPRIHTTLSQTQTAATTTTTTTTTLSSLPRPHPHTRPSRTPPTSTIPPAPPTPPPVTPALASPLVDIHSYPTSDLLRLLASLLTQIASTNDALSPPSHTRSRSSSVSSPTSPIAASPFLPTLTTASLHALLNPSSTLTFHARNIPTISLEAYLLRILKYCPTTNEVFLSLLVYFDRMSRLSGEVEDATLVAGIETGNGTGTAMGRGTPGRLVIDSYNVHRLVIAGVTVASKFFSDVFYTNSRYAKVGGLPLAELNQLELQFLLLNDFRLVISTDEMQRYAEQLILFSTSGTAATATTPSPSPPPLPSPSIPPPSPSPSPSPSSTSSSSSPSASSSKISQPSINDHPPASSIHPKIQRLRLRLTPKQRQIRNPIPKTPRRRMTSLRFDLGGLA